MAERPATHTVALPRHVTYVIRRISDAAEIRQMLAPYEAYAAYAMGQLKPRHFERSAWYVARGAAGESLVLHSRGGLGNALFALGSTEGLDALLRLHPGPRQTFLTCQLHHLPLILRHFRLPEHESMARMLVEASTFHAVHHEDVRRLTGRDIREVNRLYRSDGTPAFYTAENIDDAVYYGCFEDGRLVAVAGTHVVAPEEGIAVLGNVFTAPSRRGRGLAASVTSAVTSEVLDSCRKVVLSVDPRNAPALRLYERIGYREVGRLIEGAATRRDFAIGSWLRRRVAHLRGRRYRAELVSVSLREPA
jgi:RimJ/RimL family protein N-acetyltransferase